MLVRCGVPCRNTMKIAAPAPPARYYCRRPIKFRAAVTFLPLHCGENSSMPEPAISGCVLAAERCTSRWPQNADVGLSHRNTHIMYNPNLSTYSFCLFGELITPRVDECFFFGKCCLRTTLLAHTARGGVVVRRGEPGKDPLAL